MHIEIRLTTTSKDARSSPPNLKAWWRAPWDCETIVSVLALSPERGGSGPGRHVS